MSCLERISPFSFRVRRLASRHSKGVEYWGSGLEAVDPMAITKRRLTFAARTSSGAKGSRGSAQPFGTSSSHAGGPRRPKPEDPHSRWGRLPPELGTEEGRSRRSTQPFGTSPSRAGDREDPVSGHWLPGPRKWSPGRAGSKAEGTYPVSCRPGGWSAAWVRGATAAVELEGASTASAGSPHLEPHVGRQM